MPIFGRGCVTCAREPGRPRAVWSDGRSSCSTSGPREILDWVSTTCALTSTRSAKVARRALRAAYALAGPPLSLLKDRRQAFVEQEPDISHIDSAENWENTALRELFLRLLVFAGRQPDLYQFVAHGWLVRRHTMQAVVHEDHMATIECGRSGALEDDLQVFQVGASPTGRIVGADGIALPEPKHHPGGLIYDLTLPRPLQGSESDTFIVRTIMAWDWPAVIWVERTRRAPTTWSTIPARSCATSR